MTGIKLGIIASVLAAAEATQPVVDIPMVQYGALGLLGLVTWKVWQLVDAMRKEIKAKDLQNQALVMEMVNACNKLSGVMDRRPCLHGMIPTEGWHTAPQEEKA